MKRCCYLSVFLLKSGTCNVSDVSHQPVQAGACWLSTSQGIMSQDCQFLSTTQNDFVLHPWMVLCLSKRVQDSAELFRLNDLFFCLPNCKWSRESVKGLQTCSTFHLFSAQSLPVRVVTQFLITSPIAEPILGPTVERIHRTLAIPHVKKHVVIRWLTRFLQVRFWCWNAITGRDSHEKRMNDYSVAAKDMSFVSSLSETCHWWKLWDRFTRSLAVIHHVLMMLRNSLITPKWPTGQTEMIRFGCDHRGPWVAQ